jgi:long-chain acyl-CoA synthetase
MNAIEWLNEIPKRNSNRKFLIDAVSGKVLTFGEYHRAGGSIACYFKELGLRRGDRVAILLHNSIDFAKLYLGCLYAGFVTVPVNPILHHKEINFIVQQSGAKVLIVSSDTIKQVDSNNLSRLCNTDIIQIVDAQYKGEAGINLRILDISSLKKRDEFEPFEEVTDDDKMTIIYTSGTTARPKGVIHRISDFVGNAKAFNNIMGIGRENRFYGILSMAYLGGYYNLLMLPYVGEASVVVSNVFNAKSVLNFWENAKRYNVNTLWVVPTIMSILNEMDRGGTGEKFCREQIKLSLVGTAPLPITLRKTFENRYGVTLYENYGLSETLFITTNVPYSPVPECSVGRVLTKVQVRILDDEGNQLPYGNEGEIYVNSPYLMEGYYDTENGGYVKPSMENWFPTGDIGALSHNGELFITGRKKDLIISGGINISPAAIENVLLQHQAVLNCAVVGIPHVHYGETIAVVVRLSEGVEFGDVHKELLMACKESLSITEQPSHIIEMEEFPYSSSGKIQKNRIREMLINKLGLSDLMVEKENVLFSASLQSDMIPGRVRKTIIRSDKSLIDELKKYPISIVSDCMNRMGIMDSSIYSLVRGRPFCGNAFTVEEVEGGNMMSHIALELVKAGDVLVIDGKGVKTRSCWGGLQTLMAKKRKVAAIVVYGMIRDYSDVVETDMPLYALGTSPGGPLKSWGGNINYPVAVSGVVVNPGDIIMGDDDGVVVVPKYLARELILYCERRLKKESKWFDLVKEGESTIDVVGLRSKIKDFGITFE